MIPEQHAKKIDEHLTNLRDLANELAEAAKGKLRAETHYTERLRAYEGEEFELRKLLNVYRGGSQEKREATPAPAEQCSGCVHHPHFGGWCSVCGCYASRQVPTTEAPPIAEAVADNVPSRVPR